MSYWPQWTLIVLYVISFVLVAMGWERPGGKQSLFTSLIATTITIALLIAGGFFEGMFN